MKGLPDPLVERDQAGKNRRHQQSIDSDPRFESSIDRHRVPGSIDETAKNKTPQRQPAHEGREHGTDGKGGGTEDQNEHAHPENFINQAAQPGQ